MPLQQINLDQSIYNKPKDKWGGGRRPGSVVSEALQPPQGGMSTEQRFAPNRLVEMQKAEWDAEDKLKKAERDAKVKEAQEMGMRIRDAYDKEKAAGVAQSEKVEADIEKYAMEAYKFAVDEGLDDESRKNILRAIKAKPKAYDVLQKKGLIMADGSDFVKKAGEAIEDEWYYNAEDNLMYNRKTAETIRMEGEGLAGVSPEMIADAFNYGSTFMGRLTEPTLLEKISPENMAAYMQNAQLQSQIATENYLLGQGVGKKEAHDIAYSVPIGERETTKEKVEGEEAEGEKPEGEERVGIHKNWDAPLDEEKAKGLAEFLKGNPDANLDAYRDRDGDATVDRALEILGEKPTPTTTKTKKKKTEEEKAKETKVEDSIAKIKERRGLE